MFHTKAETHESVDDSLEGFKRMALKRFSIGIMMGMLKFHLCSRKFSAGVTHVGPMKIVDK